ncbi:hypothetical protein HDU76_012531 [Blyttiomyces sp. JEL0837]|nr:hypothetical protein HDU76_012531 [Blyttiomyces sp. JEL0837]
MIEFKSPSKSGHHALSPNVLIVTPTKELCHQVLSVLHKIKGVRALTIPPPVGVSLVSFRDPDIVVTTPEALRNMFSGKADLKTFCKRTRAVVFDEADLTVGSPVGRKLLTDLLSLSRKAFEAGNGGANRQDGEGKQMVPSEGRPKQAQFIFVAATLPELRGNINKLQTPRAHLMRLLPNITTISTADLHRPPSQLTQEFVRIANTGNQEQGQESLELELFAKKMKVLHSSLDDWIWKVNYEQDLLHQGEQEQTLPGVSQMLIFCNERAEAQKVYEELRVLIVQSGMNSLARIDLQCVHAKMDSVTRSQIIARFASGRPISLSDSETVTFSGDAPFVQILVCTDVVSRGIDFTHVGTVMSFDFPTNVATYLHRVGRASRFGKPGRSIAFVTPKDEFLASLVEQAATKEYIGEEAGLEAASVAKWQPHVTLIGQITLPKDEAIRKVGEIASKTSAFEVKLTDIVIKDMFFQLLKQCVMAKVEETNAVMSLNAQYRTAFPRNEGPFWPHLSLVYGNLEPAVRERVQKEIRQNYPNLVGETVRIAEIEMWNTEGEVSSWEQVAIFPLK